MPIYAYKCESCGHAKDVLQKLSDAPLTDCPQCRAAAFKKQVTAAGFQLKGSGWYVTDFRGGQSATGAPAPASDTAAGTASTAAPAESRSAESSASSAAPAAAPAPAAASTTASSGKDA